MEPIQTATPIEPDDNKGCRAFIATAVCFWVALGVGLWFAAQCPPVGDEWYDCDEPSLRGWIILGLLAVPVALLLTTLVFFVLRLIRRSAAG
jgi:hypothetical protein